MTVSILVTLIHFSFNFRTADVMVSDWQSEDSVGDGQLFVGLRHVVIGAKVTKNIIVVYSAALFVFGGHLANLTTDSFLALVSCIYDFFVI